MVATLEGVRRTDALLNAAAETAAACRTAGCDRLVIDIRSMRGALDAVEVYDVAGRELPRSQDVRRIVRTAVLDTADNLDRVRFFETVAVNRGLTVRFFTDADQAVAWVLSRG